MITQVNIRGNTEAVWNASFQKPPLSLSRQERGCRVPPWDDRLRPPPSARTAPRPFATRRSSPTRTPCNRARSCRRSRPNAVPNPKRPTDRPAPRLRSLILAGCAERAKRRPSAVEVVHAPAPKLASILLLARHHRVNTSRQDALGGQSSPDTELRSPTGTAASRSPQCGTSPCRVGDSPRSPEKGKRCDNHLRRPCARNQAIASESPSRYGLDT
jgi:hypothetical protein